MQRSAFFRLLFPLLIYFGSRFVFNQATETANNPAPYNPPPSNPAVTNVAQVPAATVQNLPTEQIEQLIHEKINDYRISQGLPALSLDYRITNESRKYSEKMASGEAEFSHDGFDERAENLEKQALKYESVGENLAMLQGYDDLATEAVNGWIASPGHHKNIVGDYELTGIGVVKNEAGEYYFTQLFLKRL
ncbi:MAG: CAP domain-containing protein [Limnothrix sp. RL_2_0]|nr:CAP domain-containing protein [Limnothrix sp. RL_2_0]